MVAASQSILMLLPLAVHIQAWSISPQSNAQCEDPEDNALMTGDKGVTSKGVFDWCERSVNVWGDSFNGVRNIQVEDWDDGCDIAVWRSNECVPAEEDDDGTLKIDKEPIVVYKWEDHKNMKGSTSCITGVQRDVKDPSHPAVIIDIVYDCEGVLRGIDG